MTAESWWPRLRQLAALGVLLTAAGFAHAVPAPAIAPSGYEITQLNRLTGQAHPTYNLTARAGAYNTGTVARNLTATITGGAGDFIVLEGEVRFGDVQRTPLAQLCMSRDTFRVRFVLPPDVHPNRAWEFAHSLMEGLTWQLACANCGTNRPPTADAGADQSAFLQQLVTLDGSGSSDPDGNPITYAWSILTRPAGSTAALNGATSVTPTITPDREGDYTIRLIVSDGQLASAADTVIVSTLNSAPVANAGADQTAFVSQRVQLDGSASSDVDGDALTYAWDVAQRPGASTAALERPFDVDPAFTPDAPGQYVIELVVDDGTVSSTPDTMVISTANSRPVADAGVDQTARVGDTAALDGSASRDADGDSLTYRWSLSSRPANSTTALQGATSPNPTLPVDRAGTYVAQLIVNDGQADSDADTVSVSTANSPPVAVPGANQTVHFGATVLLNGLGSSDPDGDGLTFTWALLSVPAGSTAALSDATVIAPSFVADRPGTYVVQLIVNDGIVNGAPASLTVTAQNAAPVARDDSATVDAGAAVTVNVLANDTDADGDALRVEAVTQPANGAVTFTATSVTYTPNAGFSGADSFSYLITDGADTADAVVRMTVEAGANAPPIADAGPDMTGYAGDVFPLDGRGSRDPDGTALTFAWTQVAGPSGTLSDADTPTPRLTTIQPGTYAISLTVSDGVATAADEVVIQVAVLPALTIEDATVAEGDAGTTTATFRVSLAVSIGRSVTVTYSTQDGTATGGEDYTPATGTLAFAPGTLEPQFIDVGVLGDTSVEPDETFSVVLTSPVNAVLPNPPASGTITNDDVEPAGPQVLAIGPRAVVAPGRNVRMQIVLDEIAAAGGVRVILTSSNQAAATVPAEITVPEGEESLWIDLTAGDAPSQTTLSASTAGGPVATTELVVSAQTSLGLIEAAVQAGTLTAEQAFVYRVLAEFGSSGLPSEYAGARSAGFDSQAFFELGDRFEALSAEQRAAIERFLLPPVYRGSWAERVLGPGVPSPLAGAQASKAAAPRVNVRVDPIVGYTACREDGNEELLPYVRFYETENFRIWYPQFPVDHPLRGDNARADRIAQILRNSAERALTVLTGGQTAGRFRQPMSDAGITCNGGNSRIDVYLAGRWWTSGQVDGLGFAGDTAGYTMPYYLRAESSPAYIVFNYDLATAGALTERRTRSYFTHELMHVIDFAYAKQGPIGSYTWLKDAMAHWAMDFVWPQDQMEHEYADQYFEVENRYPLNFDDARTVREGLSGYTEYVFFFWAHRRYNGGPDTQPTLLMQVLSEAERLGNIDAISNALVFAQLGQGQQPAGFASAWPEFALASWNNYVGGVQDDFYLWDSLESGMYARFEAGENWATTDADFGAPETDRALFSGIAEQQLPVGGGGRIVAPLSSMYHHFDLGGDDPGLAFVLFDNRLADPDFAPQPADDVVQRIEAFYRTDEDGWQGPFDWTFERFPMFCRDETEARILEVVVVYTNSAPPPRGLGNGVSISSLNNWQWDVGGEEVGIDALMSNAACWRWRLSSSSYEDRGDQGIYRFNGSAQGPVVMTRTDLVAFDGVEGPIVEAIFRNEENGGTFTWEQNYGGECPIRVGPVTQGIVAGNAGMGITLLSRDPVIRSRGVTGGGGSMATDLPWQSCDDSDVFEGLGTTWFAVSMGQIRQLNDSGRDLTGVEVVNEPGRTVSSGYALSADRQ